ncbi:MAG: acetyltransferase [Sulfurospirillum sp.]|nr:acetyltransferase [Sulfurospirillum sp.]
MKNIIVIGSGGHAKVVIDIIEKEKKYNIIGLIDTCKSKGDKVFNYSVLGEEKDLINLTEQYNIYGCIIAIGDNWMRSIVKSKIAKLEIPLKHITTIHPSAVIGKEATIGNGTVIMANSTIGSNTTIDSFCIVNTNASIDHDSNMSLFSSIAPGVTTGGNVSIGEYSAISIGASIIHNITIGKHTIVGAGSLVVNDIKDFIVEYGTPSKFIRKREKGDKYL